MVSSFSWLEHLRGIDVPQEGVLAMKDPLLHYAQALLLVHAEDWDGSPAFNCAVAMYHCSLMAHTLGVGVCLNGWVENSVNNNRKLKNRLTKWRKRKEER